MISTRRLGSSRPRATDARAGRRPALTPRAGPQPVAPRIWRRTVRTDPGRAAQRSTADQQDPGAASVAIAKNPGQLLDGSEGALAGAARPILKGGALSGARPSLGDGRLDIAHGKPAGEPLASPGGAIAGGLIVGEAGAKIRRRDRPPSSREAVPRRRSRRRWSDREPSEESRLRTRPVVVRQQVASTIVE